MLLRRPHKRLYNIDNIIHMNSIVMEGIQEMNHNPHNQDSADEAANDLDEEEYDVMEMLERLETLREDMEDLGVTTLAEVIQRIDELHRQLDLK